MTGQGMKYKRLPGRRRGFFRSASLWSGDDHLLAVTGWRFAEDYRRYYYRDVQALVLARTRRWAVTMPWLGFAILLLMTAIFAKVASVAWFYEGCLYALLALAAAWLLVSLKLSTRCKIQTAVSRDELPSLFRLRSAEKALRVIAERVMEVQGTLVDGWTAQVVEVQAAEPLPSLPGPAAMAPPVPAAPQKTKFRLAMGIALAASLGSGMLLYLRGAGSFWFAFVIVQMALAIVNLVSNERAHGPRSIKRLMLAVMIFVGAMAALIYGSVVINLLRAASAGSGWMPRRDLTNVYATGCLALAAVSVYMTVRGRKE